MTPLECTETRHVLATVDALRCRCGHVVVTDAGLALASDPDVPLRPTSISRISAPTAGVETREWKFTADEE